MTPIILALLSLYPLARLAKWLDDAPARKRIKDRLPRMGEQITRHGAF
jgi:hypothetical protein